MPHHSLYPASEVRVVDIDDWAEAKGSGILETNGAGPCICVSVYNKKLRYGALGHFTAVSLAPDLFEEFLDAASLSAGNRGSTRVWIGGGRVYSGPDQQQGYDDRELVIARVNKVLGRSALEAAWLEDGQSLTTYTLDVVTGKEGIEIDSNGDEEWLDYGDEWPSGRIII